MIKILLLHITRVISAGWCAEYLLGGASRTTQQTLRSGCCVACDCKSHATQHPLHAPQAETFMHHTTRILTKYFK
jgi:hypothetical protein